MSYTVDPGFMTKLQRYGASDIKACFHCGNCTAVCSLTEEGATFPRRFIRYAQLGLQERLAQSKEMWLCYYCGDCSATCPRQAEPGEFVAAARRYIIAHYDPTTLARRLYTSTWFSVIFLAVIAAALTLILLAGFGSMPAGPLQLGEFINVAYIHYTGQAVMILAGVVALLSLITMVRRLNRALGGAADSPGEEKAPRSSFGRALVAAAREILAQRRFSECDEQGPWYVRRRTLHLAVMWGFLGLLGATTLDLLFKEPFSHVPIWYPPRVLGTVAGLLVLYGATALLILRATRPGKYFAHSFFSDWFFLVLLWGVTVTGFVVEIGVYLPSAPAGMYIVFLVHMVGAMLLVFLLPFTKFAHAVLRPVALFIHELHRSHG